MQATVNWRHFVFHFGTLRGSMPGRIYAFALRDSLTNDLPVAGYTPEGLNRQPAWAADAAGLAVPPAPPGEPVLPACAP